MVKWSDLNTHMFFLKKFINISLNIFQVRDMNKKIFGNEILKALNLDSAYSNKVLAACRLSTPDHARN